VGGACRYQYGRLQPRMGMLTLHPGGHHLHAVDRIESGYRYTYTAWFLDPEMKRIRDAAREPTQRGNALYAHY